MTAGLAEQVRILAITDALRRVAPDNVPLADSLAFCRRLDGLSPAAPGFDEQVRAAVRETAGPTAAEAAAEAAAAEADRAARQQAAARARRASGQWTAEDYESAAPAEVDAARARGQLAALGIPAPKQNPMDGMRWPSAAQVARWNAMPPWQRQRERAKWMAQGREAGLSDAVQPPEVVEPRERVRDPRSNPTTQELLDRATRRAQLTSDYAGEITAADVTIADPQVVSAWMQSGKLTGLGIAPQRARR